MIADLKPYPTMKDSGVEWLGNVPEHWEVKRLKAIARIRYGLGQPPREASDGLPLIRATNVERGRIVEKDLVRVDPSDVPVSRNAILSEGEIVVVRSGAYTADSAIIPKEYAGAVAGYDMVVTVNKAQPRFVAHAFLCKYVLNDQLIISSMRSAQPHLNAEELGVALILLPPLPEQAAIVRYLDHVDRRIRRYVRAKQKLIGLLEEQKQAIIHRAVTRGLDPDVPLKDSGVEWLGDVPEHWEMLLLGRGLKGIAQGWSPVAAEGELSPEQWAVLTLSSVKKGKFNPSAIKPISNSAKIPKGIEVKDGDLLLTRSNTRELVGDVCIAREVRPKTVICDLIYRLTPDSRLFDSVFLAWQLLSPIGRKQIEQDARGSSGTMPKINHRHIRSWRLLAPPLSEQRHISRFIEIESGRITTAVDSARREIELLSEYQIRLTADVVTGKLDVREAAANLPDEPDELELLVEADELVDDPDAMLDDLDAVPE